MIATEVHQITQSDSRAPASTSASSSAAPSTPPDLPRNSALNEDDQAFLSLREEVIDAGRNAFLAVGIALLEIRDYRGGLLYASRFGTFERYCRKRWDFGRAHAYRLTDAAQIYRDLCPRSDGNLSPIGDNGAVPHESALPAEPLPSPNAADPNCVNHTDDSSQAVENQHFNPLSPIGDKGSEDPLTLPTNEWQLRPLKKLADPVLRRQAWGRARQAAGLRPLLGRDVERAVRSLMIENGAIAPSARKPKSPPGKYYKVSAADVGEIRKCMKTIRDFARLEGIEALLWSPLERVDRLLP